MLVTLYGRLSDLAAPQVEVAVPDAGCTVAELRIILGRRYPAVADAVASPGVRACVGDAVVPDSWQLSADEPVEFLPPVSGG